MLPSIGLAIGRNGLRGATLFGVHLLQQGRGDGELEVGPLLFLLPKGLVKHPGVQRAIAEGPVFHEHFVELDVVADAADAVLAQRGAHAVNGFEARRPPGGELGDHRVVEHGHIRAFVDAGIVAYIAARGRAQEGDLAG